MSSHSSYGEKNYWDQRYQQQDEKYDWYLSYPSFKEQLLPYMNVFSPVSSSTSSPPPTLSSTSSNSHTNPTSSTLSNGNPSASSVTVSGPPRPRSSLHILVVGCGNSELSKQMYDDGFTSLVSIDYSDVVIEKMKAIHAQCYPQLRFECMDVRSLSYPSSSFDTIVDKGTLDAILCGTESAKNSELMLQELSRVLKPNGQVFIITYGQPQSRLNYLEKTKYNWKVSFQLLGSTRYLYVCKKEEEQGETNERAEGEKLD